MSRNFQTGVLNSPKAGKMSPIVAVPQSPRVASLLSQNGSGTSLDPASFDVPSLVNLDEKPLVLVDRIGVEPPDDD